MGSRNLGTKEEGLKSHICTKRKKSVNRGRAKAFIGLTWGDDGRGQGTGLSSRLLSVKEGEPVPFFLVKEGWGGVAGLEAKKGTQLLHTGTCKSRDVAVKVASGEWRGGAQSPLGDSSAAGAGATKIRTKRAE